MLPVKRCIPELLARRHVLFKTALLTRVLSPNVHLLEPCRGKKSRSSTRNTPFQALEVKPSPDDINIGEELSGSLTKKEVLQVLFKFSKDKEVKLLATNYGLEEEFQEEVQKSFRNFCMDAKALPVDLHLVLSDILQGAGHSADLFPYFMKHARAMYPHLDCLDELKKISDFTTPANWYPEARAKTRKIIFHAGPTNSGKTYHALKRFMTSKSGVYCGPLKLLVAEVYQKCNAEGTSCDMVTGEERLFGKSTDSPSLHVSCTIEMTKISENYEVAIIDEIQMIKDSVRGWAWSRALLGIVADEVHVCGEPGAIDLVKKLCATTGDELEVQEYKRLTPLSIETSAVQSLDNVQPGDCIVCFNKNDIFTVSRELEKRGVEVAVIYGSLPPNTKLAQAAKFNDPDHSCKVLVATDAIGMGINLHIRRVIFYSLMRPTTNEKGEREVDTIAVSSALQIAGRAGRFGTKWAEGFVTTFKDNDLPTLSRLLETKPEPLTQAGLHPTAEQIELYAYHLPTATLSNLLDIFISLSTVDDSLYFMCNTKDFKFLADMIQHVPLPLRARYVFCCAPIDRKQPLVCAMFLKFARQYSKNQPITTEWLTQRVSWPLKTPQNIADLVYLETVFDVMDLYLWLSYRFVDLFPDPAKVKEMQEKVDENIHLGLLKLASLITKSRADGADKTSRALGEADFGMNSRKLGSSAARRKHQDSSENHHGHGRLTNQLLAKGLLTPHMLDELQREWKSGMNLSKSEQKKSRTPSYDSEESEDDNER